MPSAQADRRRHGASWPLVGPATLVILIAAATLPASAQAPLDIDPTGGLRQAGDDDLAPSGMTREELVRKWDADGNGTIDESEAAVARARMRRSRLETQMNASIDPLTGRPRVIEADEKPPIEAAAPAAPPPGRKNRAAPPGTRAPEQRAPEQRTTTPRPTGATMGGVRAGAPAARPGYGALKPESDPQRSRSTGRNASGRTTATSPDGRGGFRGGLLPTARPGRLPRSQSPLPAPLGRPESPVPLMPGTPRINADEIGGF